MFALVATVALAGCDREQPSYVRGADQIKGIGVVPHSVKLAVAQIMDQCRTSAKGRSVFFQWERPPGSAPFTVSLSHNQFTSRELRTCLDTRRNALGLQDEIDWLEEPPPPPRASETQEAYLLLAAERPVTEPANLPPIPEARKILPEVLKSCGIDSFRKEDLSAGIVALRFTVLPRERTDRLSCVQRAQPKGAWVEQSGM